MAKMEGGFLAAYLGRIGNFQFPRYKRSLEKIVDRNTTRVDGIDGEAYVTRLIKNKNRETVRAHDSKKLKH